MIDFFIILLSPFGILIFLGFYLFLLFICYLIRSFFSTDTSNYYYNENKDYNRTHRDYCKSYDNEKICNSYTEERKVYLPKDNEGYSYYKERKENDKPSLVNSKDELVSSSMEVDAPITITPTYNQLQSQITDDNDDIETSEEVIQMAQLYQEEEQNRAIQYELEERQLKISQDVLENNSDNSILISTLSDLSCLKRC